MPGGVATVFEADGAISTLRNVDFWRPPQVPRGKRNFGDLVAELRGLLDTAVKRAMPDIGAASVPQRRDGFIECLGDPCLICGKGRSSERQVQTVLERLPRVALRRDTVHSFDTSSSRESKAYSSIPRPCWRVNIWTSSVDVSTNRTFRMHCP